MIETVHVDGLAFEIQRSNRKSIGIVIERDGYLVVRAPRECPLPIVEEAIRAKLPWLYGKLKTKDVVYRPPVVKQYVTGEGFYYLGNSYRLLVQQPDPNEAYMPPLRLFGDRFILNEAERHKARTHFISWYTIHAEGWLPSKLPQFENRVGVASTGIRIVDLGFRWASCSSNGTVNFHWRTIMLPTDIIEYIIVHELAHLQYHHHNDDFWQVVGRIVPDYNAKSDWLLQHGAKYAL